MHHLMKTVPIVRTVPIVVLGLFLLSGCFSLSREATPRRHFVLDGAARSGPATAVANAIRVSVGFRPPQVAGYLATPYFVVREGDNRIGFSDADRWGEDLPRGLSRAVASHLAARAPSLRIETAPWSPADAPDYTVQLHVQRFEGVSTGVPGDPGGEAHLLVAWEVVRRIDGERLIHGATEVRQPGWTIGDFDTLVRLLDGALARLAEDLVIALDTAQRR